jgi:hypothetical protein
MRRRGADYPVVALKRGNARGAKGRAIAFEIGSTDNGRNPMFDGRRQPSRDGTSRMTRECQVRICDRLGVQIPGPTRPNAKCPARPGYGCFRMSTGLMSDTALGQPMTQIVKCLLTNFLLEFLRSRDFGVLN